MRDRTKNVLLATVATLLLVNVASGGFAGSARAQRSGPTKLSETWSGPIEMLGHAKRSDENLTNFNQLVADKLSSGWTLVNIVSSDGGQWENFESHTLTGFFTK
ncbi:MAG: hypothetical protein JWM95_3517 [Gemmatimonadetes bacterium]|nr:hypothetical protein [Gemmatimonadota bacterium]